VSRSPSHLTGNKESKDQTAKSNFPARRFDQTQGRMPWAPPPVRSFLGAGTTNQNQTQSHNVPRGRGQGCWTCGKLGCHSLLHRQNDRQNDASLPRQARIQPLVNNPQPRRKSGCQVCGRFGCHTIFHDDDGFETSGDDRGFPLSPHLPP